MHRPLSEKLLSHFMLNVILKSGGNEIEKIWKCKPSIDFQKRMCEKV